MNTVLALQGVILAGAGSELSTESKLRGVFRYSNNSWTQVVLGGEIVNDLAASKNGKVLLAATGQSDGLDWLYRSIDGGASWSTDGQFTGQFRAVAMAFGVG